MSRTSPLRAVAPTPTDPPLVRTDALAVRFGETVALRGVDFAVRPGEIVALMGRNGAGKSSLLTALVGLVEPSGGTVTTVGLRPDRARPSEMVRAAGLVLQEPADLLYAASVADECREADADAVAKRTAAGCWPAWLPRSTTQPIPGTCPRPATLPGSGRRAGRRATVVLLDEPTRGLDYTAKRRLTAILRELVSTGSARAVVLATHDVELVAELATRGRDRRRRGGVRRTDRRRRRRIAGLRPQVAKVMAPQPWLTVGDVAAALGAAS